MTTHQSYRAEVEWTGVQWNGTSSYTAYSRDNEVRIGEKAVILGTAEPTLHGDPDRVSPEELLVGAVAQSHMLWFLQVAAQADVAVQAYLDRAIGTVHVEAAATGVFTEIVLRPRVRVDDAAVNDELLARLHRTAHDHSPIARSLKFPVHLRPVPLGADHSEA
jgi:organic hydroperoxide reductase OsmC/OhrA